MGRAEVPFHEVEAAVREYVAGHQADGVFTIDPAMVSAISGPAGFDQAATRYSWDRGRMWDRFTAQLRRALDKLAADGVLRKAGAGTTGPDGRAVDRRDVRYYTPAAWDEAATRAAGQLTAEQEAAARRLGAAARLAALGLGPDISRAGDLRLDPGSWERLLDLAEKGARRG